MKRVLYTVLCLSACSVHSEGRISTGIYLDICRFGFLAKDKAVKKAIRKDKISNGSGCIGLSVGYVWYIGKVRLYGEIRGGVGCWGTINTWAKDEKYVNKLGEKCRRQDLRNILKRGMNLSGVVGVGYKPSNWYVGVLCYTGYEGCKYNDGDEEKSKWKTKGVMHFMPAAEVGYDNKKVNIGFYLGRMINTSNKIEGWLAKIEHGICGGLKLSVLL